MKQQILIAGLVVCTVIAYAQQPPAPPKPPTIEERLKRTNELLQREIQPTLAQKTAIETAYKKFFTGADKLRKDNPPPQPPPPDPKVKEAMDKLVKERDESIKKILTAAQFEKYKGAAKKLQPPGPGGPNGQNLPPQHR